MPKKTPLFQEHIASGAHMVDFAGWSMPVHYGSQIQEHQAVRSNAGMFDVSHMTVVDVAGADSQAFLRQLLANDVMGLELGRALYSCMLNEQGGVIDDLIVYFFSENQYRLVVNAATRDKDIAWIISQAKSYDLELKERTELAMIAVQGPLALQKSLALLPAVHRSDVECLSRFAAMCFDEWCVARTGYTGEDGLEIILPGEDAQKLWRSMLEAGVKPAGLGARDTLRLEAGMSLYGQDMDENVTPLESGLAWTIAWDPDDRNFIGRQALEHQRSVGIERKMVGIRLLDRGVLRAGQVVVSAAGSGVLTSGTYSPTLNQSIGLARVPQAMGTQCEVELRGRKVAAEVVKYPFVRNGQILI